MAVTMKNAVFWDVTPCGSCKNKRIGGTFRLHHQGDKNWRARNNVNSNQRTKLAVEKYCVTYTHPDGGDTFLRNIGSYMSHTA
jgi:hypothetical protein